MLHEPATTKHEQDHAIGHKTRYGVQLFLVYGAVYVVFVAINVMRPEWMAARTVLGMNLAVLYGFGLILLAVVMGVVYNAKCSRLEDSMNAPKAGPGGRP